MKTQYTCKLEQSHCDGQNTTYCRAIFTKFELNASFDFVMKLNTAESDSDVSDIARHAELVLHDNHTSSTAASRNMICKQLIGGSVAECCE